MLLKSTARSTIVVAFIFSVPLYSCSDLFQGERFTTAEQGGTSSESTTHSASTSPINHSDSSAGASTAAEDPSQAGVSGKGSGGTTSAVAGNVQTAGAPAANGGTSTNNASAACPALDLNAIRIEAEYIRKCQFLPADKAVDGYGAIAYTASDSTVHIPEKISIAGMSLLVAAKLLNDPTYRDSATFAAEYLARAPDKVYGGWKDQYNFFVVKNPALSIHQTAMTVLFFHKLGFNSTRAKIVRDAGSFMISHQDLQNKGGTDDGLVCRGRDAKALFNGERWVSDNALTYQALLAAAIWSETDSDPGFAKELRNTAQRIATGINSVFLDSSGTHWKRMVDKNNVVPVETAMTADWISYSPILFDLPTGNASPTSVGHWIQSTLQLSNGSVVWDNSNFRARQSPLYSFMASMVWKKTKQCAFANNTESWTLSNNLWMKDLKDANGISGGWIDWSEPSGNQATQTHRTIETSAYAILNWAGDFSFAP